MREPELHTIAVIGTGSIGMKHLAALRQIAELRLVAIPTRPERISQLEAAGYTTAKNPYDAARLGARLCVVATDTSRHVQDSLSALEDGLDLLVEKPLAVDAAEGQKLCAVAVETGRHVFVGCRLRFSESLHMFRGLLSSIGCLHSVHIECRSYLPDWRPERPYRESYSARAAEGGVLRDLIHEIDYAGWLFGWPTALQANVRNLGRFGIEADEVADLMWETADGCLISVGLDYLTRPPRRRMIASGELGTLEWDGIERTVTLALAGEPVKITQSMQTHDEMLLAQDRAFIEACCGSHDRHLVTGEDGVKALAVCDAARRASDSRREERVEYL